ncbi:hypothetical protein AB0K14_21365 [Actinosynnema sp. NPDC050801]|uniref:hypothetical protein n=1 Tax=unclassified Actinosynnema TaxID=2637065 RepID=UPI0033D03AB2
MRWGMADFRDEVGRGRLRWLLLAVAPLTVAAGVPWLLVLVCGDRLPERAYVYGWSRVGPQYAHLAPTWSSWSAGWSYCLLYAVLLGVVFRRVRRWPRLQRMVVAGGWTAGTVAATQAVCGVLAVVDVPGYPPHPMARWYDVVPAAVGLVGGVAGLLLAGSAPASPETADAPPAGLPARRLGRTERALFSEVVWSTKARVVGVLFLLCVPVAMVVVQSFTAVVLLVVGLFAVLQSTARIQIDGTGVSLTLPLLGRARRRVPYRHVRYAETAERAPTAGWGLAENKRYWGYAAGRGPVMVLRLTDDRPFVAALRDPEAAVALVNGHLARARTSGTTTGD